MKILSFIKLIVNLLRYCLTNLKPLFIIELEQIWERIMKARIKRFFKGLAQTLPGLFFLFVAILLYIYYPKVNSYVFKDFEVTMVSTKTTTAPAETTYPLGIKLVETTKVPPYELQTDKHKYYKKNTDSKAEAKRNEIKRLEKEAKSKISFKSSVPYKVKVNRAENFVMIYGIDIHGKYTIPYKCFVCSSAKNAKKTLLGKYRLNDRYRWHVMVDGSFAQYAIRFYDELMLHSVPYYKKSSNSLETEEYNKLGHSASLGCIRMRVSDIKWIYDHCKQGTEIKIYDKKGEKPPIPYEEPQRLDKKQTKSCWDPTDPNKKNPWRK